ncbi:hypothetical protein MPER_09316, partial [Moniliophthora perniciosa FA553]
MLPEVAVLLVSALVGRASWFKGHIDQVHSLYGWDFHEMMESYGPTTVYDNWFGKKVLYTWDTKAMQHILIKEWTTWGMAQGQFLHGCDFQHEQALVWRWAPLGFRFSPSHSEKDASALFFDESYAGYDPNLQFNHSEASEHNVQKGGKWNPGAFELVGQSNLGVSFDSLDDDSGAHPYGDKIKNVIPLITKVFLAAHFFLPWTMKIGTSNFRRAIAKRFPWEAMRYGEHLAYYMWDLSVEIYQEKKRALEKGDEAVAEQLTRGKDILSVL